MASPPNFFGFPPKKLDCKIKKNGPPSKFYFGPIKKKNWTAEKKKKNKNGISAITRIGREIQCLSYSGFY